MPEFLKEIVEFFNWFFGLKWDEVTLQWFEANKYTVGFLLAAPVLIYRWMRRNAYQIQMVDQEYDELVLDDEDLDLDDELVDDDPIFQAWDKEFQAAEKEIEGKQE